MSSGGYGAGRVPPGVALGPEALQPRPDWTFASYGQRAGAALVDLALKTVVAAALLVAVGSATGIGFLGGDETSGFVGIAVAVALAFLGFAVASLLYEPVYMALSDGRTLGKQLTGCRVVRAGGQPMTFGFALLREVAVKALAIGVVGNAITASLPFATLLDSLWPLWDAESRALHDLVVDTRVVAEPLRGSAGGRSATPS